MKSSIKIPFAGQMARQRGTVATLCIVCVLFFMAVGCGMKEPSPEEGLFFTDNGAEIWVGKECNCKEELYEYRGCQRIYLDDQFVNNWLFVGFHPQVQDAEIVDFLKQTGFFKPVNRKIDRQWEWRIEQGIEPIIEEYYATILVNTKEQKKCTQLKDIIRELQESPLVAYTNLVFWSKEHGMGSFTSYFYVNVGYTNSGRKDLFDLYEVAHETNTAVIERPFHDAWSGTFLLKVNHYSQGNAMQMANYFSETGKFSLEYPHWIYEFPLPIFRD